jgi:plasmid stabilization system protein ParE
MAKRKIIWSYRARIKLNAILEFYNDRNQSKTYSFKFFRKINKEIKLLLIQPDLGIKTQIESIRGLIVEDYILFYENSIDSIIIHTIWDCRQNPDDLIIK